MTTSGTQGGAPAQSALTRRIIPCLDVTAGRVVKGVNFVNLTDAGDPSRSPAATTSRAPTNSPSWTSPPPATAAT